MVLESPRWVPSSVEEPASGEFIRMAAVDDTNCPKIGEREAVAIAAVGACPTFGVGAVEVLVRSWVSPP
jgi:hypothetical protein